MRKLTTLVISILASITFFNAQNLVTNPGFEDDPTTYIVSNDLRRVDNLTPTSTLSGNPTAASIPVTGGLWVKKAANIGYIKSTPNASNFNSGLYGILFRIVAGSTQTGLGSWNNAVMLQKLATGLSHTKKYVATVWAKADPSASNTCTQFVMYLSESTLKANYTATIPLTGGSTWTKYTAVFDLPTWVSTRPTADFSTAFFGVGIKTTYDAASKTNYSGVYLDDFSLVEAVEVNASASTGGTITSGAGAYAPGESVTVVATPDTGFRFLNWTLDTSDGAILSIDASYTFTVAANTTLVANFESANTTGIENTQKENVSVFVNEQNEIVIKANEGSNYAIYNTVGQQISAGKVNNNLALKINSSKGVYIVKAGDVTRKVIIK